MENGRCSQLLWVRRFGCRDKPGSLPCDIEGSGIAAYATLKSCGKIFPAPCWLQSGSFVELPLPALITAAADDVLTSSTAPCSVSSLPVLIWGAGLGMCWGLAPAPRCHLEQCHICQAPLPPPRAGRGCLQELGHAWSPAQTHSLHNCLSSERNLGFYVCPAGSSE